MTSRRIIIIVVVIAVLAPLLAPYNPVEQHILQRLQPSSQTYLLGTDHFGRDILSRIIYGARISLTVGVLSILLGLIIGGAFGLVAGYKGGWVDNTIMRVMDVLLAFPVLLLALALVSLLGAGLRNIFIVIMVVQIPLYARITRARVLSLKEKEFVKASRALGGGYFHILLKRILPNTLTPLIVMGTLGVATAILNAAALSFLGFGPSRDIPEWGAMIGYERNSMFNAPHLVIFPGIAIMITVLAFNLLGDGLRDALDPRLAYTDVGMGAGE